MIPRRDRSPPRKPWNGRTYETRALRYARLMAKSLGAELRVLYVAPDRLAIDETDLKLERRLEAILGSCVDPAWALRVRYGESRQHIVDEANSGRYGLVVISAHRRAFSSDIVLGSTVERLLRHSRVPMHSVPSGRPSRARRQFIKPLLSGKHVK